MLKGNRRRPDVADVADAIATDDTVADVTFAQCADVADVMGNANFATVSDAEEKMLPLQNCYAVLVIALYCC